MDHLKFSSLLCSQVCHDLAGPLSVIDNTLELINPEELRDINPEEFNFISKATKQSVIQLKFLRILFGNTQKTLKLNDIFIISDQYLGLKGIKLLWVRKNLPIEANAIFIKLVMSFFYGSKIIIPYGGDIKVNHKSENDFEIEFISKKIIDDEKIFNLINSKSIYEVNDTKFLPFMFSCFLKNKLEFEVKKTSKNNSIIYKANKR
ncbi:MAG: hypothetical protein CFH01_00197 [Alphaproteobacteria bacterium MarineAlpha2_Bin1]|nr:MAG: hypothetical protein CFH01_00197 [Alphaproteobacteria bacterium MarineAlpha2_Bin1]|tara:strand:- start:83 stop:697 length:615 start_codon:yes stop_codon:yes gene_type:complete